MRTLFQPAHFSAASISNLLWLLGVLSGLTAAPVFGQTASEQVFAKMLARLAANDSIRKKSPYSYELQLTGTFLSKSDSAQVIEEWRIAEDQDSIRVRLLSRRSNGKAEIAKKYESPVKIHSAKRAGPQEHGPVMQMAADVLNWIKKDSKAQMLIDGQTAGRSGGNNYILKFLAKNRTGSLWINTETAALERMEWAYGKSFGVASSGQKSVIEFAPVKGDMIFPARLIFNESSRALFRKAGSYTEIEIRNFQMEAMP